MDRIFISYSRKDEEIVNAFTNRLRDEGIKLWQDNSGSANGIPFSTRWMETIEQAIYMAGGALVFNSDSWKRSVPCRKEMEIIEKCDLPYLVLSPDEVNTDPMTYIMIVKEFCDEKVSTDENRRRSELFHNAYEYRSGMDPHHLMKSTRGIAGALKYLVTDIRAYNRVLRSRDYEKLNPDTYQYMKKFVNFAKRTVFFRITARITGTLTALIIMLTSLFAVIFVPNIVSILGGINEMENLMAVFVNSYSWECDKDPIRWINSMISIGDEFYSIPFDDKGEQNILTTDDFNEVAAFTIRYGSGVEDTVLPYMIIEKSDERYKALFDIEQITESEHYEAELSGNNGSVFVTDISTGTKSTIAAGKAPSGFAWSPDGRILAYSAGSNLYVYDAAGHGSPFRLIENFENIVQVKFAEIEGVGRCIVAVTDGDRIVIWNDPLAYTCDIMHSETIAERTIPDQKVRYGIFTDDDNPKAVYVTDNKVVMCTERSKHIGQLESGDISEFALSHDENLLAYIRSKGETREIIVSDISRLQDEGSAETVKRFQMKHEPTSLEFSADDRSIYASAIDCGMIRMDIVSEEVKYSDQNFSASCINAWGDKWILSDYIGRGYVLDSDMKMMSDKFWINGGVSCYDIVTDENHDYLFSANRGGGNGTYCSRTDLKTKDYSSLDYDPDERVASSTAVALSDDDEYVAFGYPDGSIRVFETVSKILICEKKCLGESISALRFSKDGNVLYMLGSSGTVHKTELVKYLLNDSYDNMKANWNTMKKDMKEKQQQYYNGLKY